MLGAGWLALKTALYTGRFLVVRLRGDKRNTPKIPRLALYYRPCALIAHPNTGRISCALWLWLLGRWYFDVQFLTFPICFYNLPPSWPALTSALLLGLLPSGKPGALRLAAASQHRPATTQRKKRPLCQKGLGRRSVSLILACLGC